MKKALVFGILIVFLISFMGLGSAGVELKNTVNSVYNLGEIINLEVENF